ncbi:hypothetical protein M407DRAFT_7080 [Tulasnella calospora MUT 4182]|uniref:Pre-mRNA-processing factor 19 n=1 Tax=Tulasnella calospora MUT 4182 TaxID=1051891 RepID=A0A0C3QBI6_9AGAM|nr:hypothetical protein M407DRAFT_7080 [Tulasnella calospora MUT 4182]
MYFCKISGEPPQEPVISSKSGEIYERRLILKYIQENGTEPATGEKLEETDLITLKANPKSSAPRPPSATSIPSLLHTLQNEWDSLMLEFYTLNQQHQSTRQELSNALYQQDAATRVIARLIKERDAAREALASVQATTGLSATQDVDMTEAPSESALPADVMTIIEETNSSLSSVRKKRKPPTDYAKPEAVKAYQSIHTIPSLHSSSSAGITSISLSTANPTQFLTGGNDKIVQLYDRGAGKVLATLKGHTKRINHVKLREREGENTLVVSGAADKTVRTWEELVRFEEGGEVVDLAFGGLGKEVWGVSGREVRIWGIFASLVPERDLWGHKETLFLGVQSFRSAHNLLQMDLTVNISLGQSKEPGREIFTQWIRNLNLGLGNHIVFTGLSYRSLAIWALTDIRYHKVVSLRWLPRKRLVSVKRLGSATQIRSISNSKSRCSKIISYFARGSSPSRQIDSGRSTPNVLDVKRLHPRHGYRMKGKSNETVLTLEHVHKMNGPPNEWHRIFLRWNEPLNDLGSIDVISNGDPMPRRYGHDFMLDIRVKKDPRKGWGTEGAFPIGTPVHVYLAIVAPKHQLAT